MVPRRNTQRRSARFHSALVRMVGEDPDLSLKRVVYLPRWSFRNSSFRTHDARRLSSVESDIGLQTLTSSSGDIVFEASRDSTSIVNSFIHEHEVLPQITSTSASMAPRFIAPENNESGVNLIEPSAAQHLNGFALYLLVVGLMMAAFLLMIDSTILVTASISAA